MGMHVPECKTGHGAVGHSRGGGPTCRQSDRHCSIYCSHLAKRLKSEGHYIVACDWKRNEHMPVSSSFNSSDEIVLSKTMVHLNTAVIFICQNAP